MNSLLSNIIEGLPKLTWNFKDFMKFFKDEITKIIWRIFKEILNGNLLKNSLISVEINLLLVIYFAVCGCLCLFGDSGNTLNGNAKDSSLTENLL